MKKTITIKQGFVGLLFEKGVLTRELPPGQHTVGGFFGPAPAVEVLDLRERSTTIKNQEILTGDKVSVRLSLLVSFRVTDAQAAVLNVQNFEDRLYEDVQLAARRFLATRSLDQILKDRNDLSEAIQADISGPAKLFGVTVLRADVKDIIFPGNLRELMNRVIETERQAEANLIAARSRAAIADIDAQARALVSAVETQAALDTQQAKLRGDEALAQLVAKAPALVRLKELEALKEFGNKANTHFYVGVDRMGKES